MFITKGIRDAYNRQIDGSGLAIFRVAYSLILLGEIIQLFYFRHLVYDKVPYIEVGAFDPTIPMIMWMMCVFLIIIGAFTRIAAVINYVFSLVLIGTITTYEYHMFYAYMGINFLLIFLPVSTCCSVDRLRLKLKYSNTRFEYNPPNSVSALSYYFPIMLGIGFVYFDSIFFKLTSHLWMHGLGMWKPASLPMITHFNTSLIMNQKLLVQFLGYLTLAFELIFLFFFWFKRFRPVLLLIGIGLHIGILVEFPLPWFALGVTSIYLLMVPLKWWGFFRIKRSREAILVCYYDAECPLCSRTKIIIKHLDIFNRITFRTVQHHAINEPALAGMEEDLLLRDIYSVDKKGNVHKGLDTYVRVLNAIFYLKPLSWIIRFPGIYHLGKRVYGYVAVNRTTERCTEDNCGFSPAVLPADEGKRKVLNNLTLKELKLVCINVGLLIFVLLQVNVTYNSALFMKIRGYTGVDRTLLGRKVAGFSDDLHTVSKAIFGITSHAVFMDGHFKNYNHIVAVVYKGNNGEREFLPIIDKDGMPGPYIYGFNWVKWTFRVNSPKVKEQQLIKGIRDFTAFWAHKNNIDLDSATFEIKVKKIDVPMEWEYDFLNKQIQKPWINAGEVQWKDTEFKPNIPVEIEDI